MFRQTVAVAGPFGCRCLSSLSCIPFPLPAHQTGRAVLPHPAFVQENSCFRPREVNGGAFEPQQSQPAMQVRWCVPYGASAATQVFAVQPLAQPMPGVVIHHPIRSADRTKAKIIAPAPQGAVHFFNHCLHGLPIGVPLRHQAELVTEGLDSLV